MFQPSPKSVTKVPTPRSLVSVPVAVAKASPVTVACKLVEVSGSCSPDCKVFVASVLVACNAVSSLFSSDSIARKFPDRFVYNSCDVAHSLPSDSCKNFSCSSQLSKTDISSSNDCNLECNTKYSKPKDISLKNSILSSTFIGKVSEDNVSKTKVTTDIEV